jgi:nucleosome binding factor SPN SPT16 subunit
MYVPNTIEIPTHEADLKHHGVGFEGRSKNRQWSHRKVEREHRKKVKSKKEKEGGEVFRELSHAE